MAATDLTSLSPGEVAFVTKRVSMEATAGNAREVMLPSWCKRFTVYFTNASGAAELGYVTESGTDGAAIGNDAFPITSGAPLQERFQAGSIFLAGSSNSGFCHLWLSAYETDGRG